MAVPARPRSARAGKCVIFTSHRWGKVADLADRITIFRNGEQCRDSPSTDRGEAVTLMTGRTIDRMYPERPPLAHDAPVVLEVRDLRGEQMKGISLRCAAAKSSRRRTRWARPARPLHDALWRAQARRRRAADQTARHSGSASRLTRFGCGWGSRSCPRTGRQRG